MHCVCWFIYSTVKALFPSCASGWDAMCFWCWTVSFQYRPFYGLCNSLLSQFGLGRGRDRSPRCCLPVEPLPRDFSAVLSSLGATVWRQKAGKGPDPVSLLVLLGSSCRRYVETATSQFPVVPSTCMERSREKCLCSPVFSLPVC